MLFVLKVKFSNSDSRTKSVFQGGSNDRIPHEKVDSETVNK